ncbi:MAG: tRNA1(Val) (adenine(37)-N6)-methyltransferase [Beijerinckiaceae bacterium]
MTLTDDWFLDGRLLLRQPAKGHRVGTDALLLAAATPALGRVCDLGSGVGAVGFALQMAGAESIVMVERDADFAACARHNISASTQDQQTTLVEVDIFNRKAVLREPALADQSFDAVATNPPYDQVLRGRKSPTKLRDTAHAMQGGTLTDWLAAAVRLLKDGGVLTMIHRADRLDDVLAAMPRRAGGLVVRPVQPKAGEAATRILVAATAGSRAPLALLPALVLHEADGTFAPEGALLHKGRAALSMQPGKPMLIYP